MNFYDPCSFSNPNYFTTTHISFNWYVNFNTKQISGSCDLKLKKTNENDESANDVLLDTRALIISKVLELDSNKELSFELGTEHKAYGQMLRIHLGNVNSSEIVLRIVYETSPQSSALQWLDAQMTLGQRLPYLFSQCQAIHARSLYPCQDTPAVKFTYDARVRVQRGFVALMSAMREEPFYKEFDNDLVEYSFKQMIKIPSYLLAIAVGDLVSKRIGPRSHVWTERELVDEAAEEFSETEEMIRTGESIAGPYIWGIYDLLVLPPTFPYGGMENPCLTFVTPNLIAGDKSLADVVIHEISHSWTGNLITNRNWEHFWLNEGFTMFLQRKIMSRMRGEAHRQFDCLEGWRKMREAVRDFGADNQLTKLIPNLSDVDPDDSFSAIPYEKGHMLLYLLETKLGGIEVFDKYLRAHIDRFNSLSYDSDDWKSFLYEYFGDKKDILDSIKWNEWLYTSGMPPDCLEFDQTLAKQCIKLSERILKEEVTSREPAVDCFSGPQIRELLNQLVESNALSCEKIESLDRFYDFGRTRNCEVLFSWLKLGIKAKWEPIIEVALKFVTFQGRMKYTRPIYRDLFNWDQARMSALENFNRERARMHQTTASLVEKDYEKCVAH